MDRRQVRYGWAQLLARVFDMDILQCPKCGTQGMQRIAFIMRPQAIRKMLRSVGLSTDAPQFAPARPLPQMELFDQSA